MSDIALQRLDVGWKTALAAVELAGQPHPWTPAQLAEALADPHIRVWGALDRQARLLGFAVLQRLPFDAELQAITVALPARRRGIASTLLARGGDDAAEWGSERLLLEVRAGNTAAIALYRQCGFEEDGRRRGYYPPARAGGEREDALLMSLRLGIPSPDDVSGRAW
ncbi:GNAT family N-acetyltransferase [Litchfieldella rifensis]|uniref:GNAT family N-acetyltransferase n=1 Tax=Litchfieldella rifensis TaxID=762643 RepID=A0ABV7LQ93_9GAMM